MLKSLSKRKYWDKANYVTNGYWLNKNLNDFMQERLAEAPDKVCITDTNTHCTFREIDVMANNLASALYRKGIRKGDVLTCQLPDCCQLMAINLAAVKLGAVCNPIIPIYHEHEVEYILQCSGAKAIFIPEVFKKRNYVQIMQNIRQRLPDLALIIVVNGNAPEGMLDFEELAQGDGTPPPDVIIDPNEVKLLLYTSGTSAKPKGVQHTHNTITCEVNNVAAHSRCNSESVMFMPAPLTHITGYLNALELPIITGCKAVIMSRWNAEQAIKIIERYKCTISGGPTPFLQQMLHSPEINQHDVSSLQLFVCGGTAIPPELIYEAQAFGWKAVRCYGGTEFPTVTLGNPCGPVEKMAETDGQIFGYDMRIVDEGNHILPVGASGEIVVIGPALFIGYSTPDLDAGNFDPDGWFHTGDIGRLDDEGYLTITGRKKDIIIRSGENISAKEVEDLLYLHPSIEEAAIVAMPDEVTGEKACAYVKLRPGTSFSFEEMINHLLHYNLAKQKLPERLEYIDVFPYTASGKIKKYILRKDIADKLGKPALC